MFDPRRFEKQDNGLFLPVNGLVVGGKFKITHMRKGEIIDETEDANLVVNQGLDSLLNIMFHGSTQITAWYVGLFSGNYTPVATETAATIAASSTETTSYTGSRQAYVEVGSSGQSDTNAASRAAFTFTGTDNIYGAFLISNVTRGGTSGTLFSASQFGSVKNVVNTDQLLVTYTFTAASA